MSFDQHILRPHPFVADGQIMCAEMTVNGGIIMIGDHCGADAGKQEPSVTVSYEVGTGEAAPLAKAFQSHGGEIMEEPTMQFWGQGERAGYSPKSTGFVKVTMAAWLVGGFWCLVGVAGAATISFVRCACSGDDVDGDGPCLSRVRWVVR